MRRRRAITKVGFEEPVAGPRCFELVVGQNVEPQIETGDRISMPFAAHALDLAAVLGPLLDLEVIGVCHFGYGGSGPLIQTHQRPPTLFSPPYLLGFRGPPARHIPLLAPRAISESLEGFNASP
jgi:hypothetical protein